MAPASWGGIWWRHWPTGVNQRPAAEKAVAAAAAAGVGRFIGHTAEDDGAAVRWWDVVIATILGDDGRRERLVATSRDITDQQRRAAFEQQLLGIVTHDLRTPLSAVAMGAAVLARQLPVESPLASIVARFASSSRRATRLVRDLLDLTQVRVDGKLQISRVPADLHAICRQVVDELRLGHPAHTLVLATDGDGAGRWDPDRLAQAVENLVSNALRYGDPHAPVTVRCARGDGRGGSGPLLNGAYTVPTSTVNLSTEGTVDWTHWGLSTATSFNHKSGVTSQISNFSAVGGGVAAGVAGGN